MDLHGNFIIQPQFVWGDDFWQALATVYVCGRYLSIDSLGILLPHRIAAEGRLDRAARCKVGFEDASGHFKINPVFDDALPVSHGLAAIKVGEKWGFLYTNGHQVIPPKYTAAYYFRIGEHCWKSDLGTIGGCSRPSPAPRLVRRSQHKELRRYTGGRERKDCGRCTKLSVPDAKEKQREAFLASLRLLRLLRLLQRTFDAKRLPQGWLGLTWFLFC